MAPIRLKYVRRRKVIKTDEPEQITNESETLQVWRMMPGGPTNKMSRLLPWRAVE